MLDVEQLLDEKPLDRASAMAVASSGQLGQGRISLCSGRISLRFARSSPVTPVPSGLSGNEEFEFGESSPEAASRAEQGRPVVLPGISREDEIQAGKEKMHSQPSFKRCRSPSYSRDEVDWADVHERKKLKRDRTEDIVIEGAMTRTRTDTRTSNAFDALLQRWTTVAA